jgi:hypothetical protein
MEYKRKGREKEYHHEWQQKLRKDVVEFLGGKCARCGFSDIRALQIDHKDGKGRQEWLQYKKSSWKRARLILLGKLSKEKYQILCANCNWIKRAENKECG